MNNKRSIGVTLFGWFYIINGLAEFIEIIWHFIKPLDKSVEELNVYGPIIGILFISIGIGLLKLKEWARIAMLILASIAIVVSPFLILSKPTNNVIVILLFSCFILFFFTRPKLKEQFR